MPIGIIVNCLGIIIGGILGTFIGPRLSDSFKTNLNLVFGACAMTMGISSIALMKNMPAVILSYFRNSNRTCYSSWYNNTKHGDGNGKDYF